MNRLRRRPARRTLGAQRSSAMKSERIGILLTIIQQILFALDTAAIHKLSGGATLWQLGLLRGAGGLGIALCLALPVGCAAFRTAHPVGQLCRVGATIGYAWVTIYSFSVIPYADATAIAYTYALYVALLAPLIVGEIVGLRRWLAVLIGAVGAMLIIKPGMSQVSAIYAAVLLATSLNALAVLLTKEPSRNKRFGLGFL